MLGQSIGKLNDPKIANALTVCKLLQSKHLFQTTPLIISLPDALYDCILKYNK